MTESPSSLLERAATELERRAADFGPPEYWVREVRGADMSQAGAAWAKLIGPPVASPLVEWLRAESEYIRGIRSWKHLPDNTRRAVAFARIVLGEPE